MSLYIGSSAQLSRRIGIKQSRSSRGFVFGGDGVVVKTKKTSYSYLVTADTSSRERRKRLTAPPKAPDSICYLYLFVRAPKKALEVCWAIIIMRPFFYDPFQKGVKRAVTRRKRQRPEANCHWRVFVSCAWKST